MRVAVIGAGAAGLATARVLRDAGHQPHIFEQGVRLGGIWAYEPRVEDDLLGLNPKKPVYSSIYDNLRTNLPSDLMAYPDYPFDERGGGQSDWPRYPHHSHVLTYLENFARDFNLESLVSFAARVTSVVPNDGGWQLEVDRQGAVEVYDFDAVAVCNGHFSRPRVPEIPGADQYSGMQLHSHNYRRPEIFAGKRVAVLGTGASGADIVQELKPHVTSLLWCGFSEANAPRGRLRQLPLPNELTATGLSFGSDSIAADVILYCTGYLYDFPFLDAALVDVQDNHVAPLYRDILPPDWPTLGLIGLPFLVVPFPLYEMQAKWFVATLSGRLRLPPPATMRAEIEVETNALLRDGVAPRHLHRLGARQDDYYNRLARECGEPDLIPEFGELARAAQASRQRNPAGFRDERLAITLPRRG